MDWLTWWQWVLLIVLGVPVLSVIILFIWLATTKTNPFQ